MGVHLAPSPAQYKEVPQGGRPEVRLWATRLLRTATRSGGLAQGSPSPHALFTAAPPSAGEGHASAPPQPLPATADAPGAPNATETAAGGTPQPQSDSSPGASPTPGVLATPATPAPTASAALAPSPGASAESVPAPSFSTIDWADNFSAQRISGRGVPNSEVRVWRVTGGERSALRASVDAGGYWTLVVPGDSVGRLPFEGVTDVRSSSSGTSHHVFTLQEPSIQRPTLKKRSALSTTFSGTAVSGGSVSLYDTSGRLLASNISPTSGAWEAAVASLDPVQSQRVVARTKMGRFTSQASAPVKIVPTFVSTYTNKRYTDVSVAGIPHQLVKFDPPSSSGRSTMVRLAGNGRASLRLSPEEITGSSLSYCSSPSTCSSQRVVR